MYTTFTVVPILDTKQVMQAGITAEFFTPMNCLQIRSGKPVSKGWVYQARSYTSTYTNTLTVHVQLVLFEGKIFTNFKNQLPFVTGFGKTYH